MDDQDTEFIKVRDSFFEAAVNPDLWDRALAGFSDFTGGSSVNLVVLDKPGAPPVIEHFVRGDDAAYARYLGDYFAIDRRVPRVAAAQVGRILLEQDVLSEEEKRQDTVYNEILAGNGMRNLALANLSSGHLLMGIGIAPQNDADPFEADQLTRLARLLPHLRNALSFYTINIQLQLQRQMLADLFALDGKGIVVLDMNRRVLFANALAETQFSSGLISVRQGTITFRHRNSEMAWQRALQDLQDGEVTESASFMAENPETLGMTGVRVLSAAPVLEQFPMFTAPAMLMLLTPINPGLAISPTEVARFGALFRLTPAECRVIEAISAGTGLDDHASQQGIRLDTARKQLKSAMAKCGVTSQKALISRLERFCLVALR